MQHEAIETISQLALSANARLNEHLQQKTTGALLSPDNMKVHDLESLLPAPRRFTGQMSTTSIDSFIDYFRHQGEQHQPLIFINTEAQPVTAVATFDLGSIDEPGHGNNSTVLSLQDTPELAAVVKVKDRALKQSELADFLEDWQHILLAKAGDEVLHPVAAINAVRHVTVKASASATHQEGHFNATRSAMEEVEARSAVDRLPEYIVVRLVPHVGMKEIDIQLRVALKTGEEKPYFILRWMGEAAQRKEIAENLQDIIAEHVQAKGIFQGSFCRHTR